MALKAVFSAWGWQEELLRAKLSRDLENEEVVHGGKREGCPRQREQHLQRRGAVEPQALVQEP